MGVMTNMAEDQSELHIYIDGRFDYHLHSDFRNAYQNVTPATTIVIDLEKASYIDSSAMGMLLLLREHLGGDAKNIRIINCNQEVAKALAISNLDRMFLIQ